MHTTDKSSRNSRLLTSGLVLLSASALMMIGQQNASAQTVSTTPVSTVAATTSAATSEPVQSPAAAASTVVEETPVDDDNTVNLWGVTTKLQLAPTTTADSTADSAVDEVTPAATNTADSQPTATESSSEGTTQKAAATDTTGADTTATTSVANDAEPAAAQSTTADVVTTTTPDVNLTGETSTQTLGKNAGNPTDLTVTSVANSTDPAIKPVMSNGFYDILTNLTSFGAALLAFPILATRQMTQVVAWGRSVLEPGRYSDVSSTWKPLDAKYDTANTEAFYTEAQDWYNNQVVKENWTVPMADGQGQVAGEYLKNGDSKKTLIFGQGWTTEPHWMGYLSKIFYDMGYNVLNVYTQGQSSSDGEFITFGAKDSADWVNWVNKVNEVNGADGEVVLYGQSLGADIALQAAAEKDLPSNVKAVIADCGYSTIPSLMYTVYGIGANMLNNVTSLIGWNLNGQIPLVPFNKFLANLNNINRFFTGVDFDQASGLTAVQNSTIPALFISTADDPFIPTAETQALYNASNASLKQLWVLTSPVGGHATATNAVADYQAHFKAFMAAIDAMNGGVTVEAAASMAMAA